MALEAKVDSLAKNQSSRKRGLSEVGAKPADDEKGSSLTITVRSSSRRRRRVNNDTNSEIRNFQSAELISTNGSVQPRDSLPEKASFGEHSNQKKVGRHSTRSKTRRSSSEEKKPNSLGRVSFYRKSRIVPESGSIRESNLLAPF